MIISQAPFRVSFVGGGTDFEDYYKQSFGNVVSTTINKAIFVSINKKFNGKLFLRYGETELELVNHVDELKHDMVKAVLKMFNIESGIEIAIMSDIPAKGSGLGSSSALASALIQAIGKYQGQDIYKNDLAKKVSELEIDIMKKSIGYQDQYEICNGGFNKIYFDAGNILVSPINGKYSEIVHWIEKLSMLFYLGNGRNAENILDEHVKNIPDKKQVLDKQRYLVAQLIAWLNDKKQDRKIGELISECWELKKKLTPSATNEQIDSYIKSALHAGACGAKLCGAGAGGFMLVICEPEFQSKVRTSLSNLQELKFKFQNEGTKIIYANN